MLWRPCVPYPPALLNVGDFSLMWLVNATLLISGNRRQSRGSQPECLFHGATSQQPTILELISTHDGVRKTLGHSPVLDLGYSLRSSIYSAFRVFSNASTRSRKLSTTGLFESRATNASRTAAASLTAGRAWSLCPVA